MNDRPLTRTDLDEALAKHTSDEMPKIKVMIHDAVNNAQHQIMQAFPNGLEGHREAHEQMIRAAKAEEDFWHDLKLDICLLYTSPSPRDGATSRMPSSA